MNCKEVLGQLSEYLDQEVLGEVCRELEQHIAACQHCRIEVNTLRHTIELYKRMPSTDVPGSVEERLFKVLRLDRIESADPEV